MPTHRIETRLDENTVRALDAWRARLAPSLSRSKAVQVLLEERFGDGRPAKPSAASVPAAERLGALFVLDRVRGFGPVKFREMHEAGLDPRVAIQDPDRLPFRGLTGDRLRAAVRALSPAEIAAGRARAAEQLERASELSASILVHGDPHYPERVYESNNPVPILYTRGDPAIWADAESVAVVGSRKTRDPYAGCARAFAKAAARRGAVVVAGFALGADSIGHTAARDAGGPTVCVMPCGLDKVFPPENRALWEDLLAYERAVFVSEFDFGLRASSLTLRKRNKLIAAFAQGVLVAQSAANGGAMNAYRFGRDQKKSIATFRADGSQDTTGNAAISAEAANGDVTLAARLDESAYNEWLDKLASSIRVAQSSGHSRQGNRLFLVSCVKTKRTTRTPARDLYISTWFRKARACVEKTGCRWRILSAKYGLVHPEERIDPYEKTLNRMRAEDRRAWAASVLEGLVPCLDGVKTVVLFAGENYRKLLVPKLRERGVSVEIPMLGLSWGEQLAWFNARLRAPSDLPRRRA